MELSKSLKVLEVCNVTPSPFVTAELSLPLTYFDLPFFHCPPTDHILFFSTDSPIQSILPKLKHSLSLTLSYFLPLAGNLTWPHDSSEPIILYKPGDAVSLIIAETDVEFDHLLANHVHKASEYQCLVPEFKASDVVAPAMSLQITSFLKSGFSIGITANHVVADGKTTTMFLKSWAHICKLNFPTLPLELTPIFDRTAAKDPTGMDTIYMKMFSIYVRSDSNSSVKKFRFCSRFDALEDVVRGTFELTRDDIENLKKKVTTSQTHHLTTFVLTFSYVSTCMIKAQGIEGQTKIVLLLLVDWRPRYGFPIPLNYFGNGITGHPVFIEAREFEKENVLTSVSNKISDAIVELEEKVKKHKDVEIIEEDQLKWSKEMPISKIITVAWSPRFGIYETDFGWGSCKKLEITSAAPGIGFSMAESRNGNGGVEVGIALPNDAMNTFTSLFCSEVKQS